MAKFGDIRKAFYKSWELFIDSLEEELGNDFDRNGFNYDPYKIEDYVMQATNFGVDCPSCGKRLDNEDELEEDGCIYCNEDK